ncbi:hypothetical protein RFI_38974, partial [Reticulomyxa filosa]
KHEQVIDNKIEESAINNRSLQKEMEKTEMGYCTNDICLASKLKLPVWINIGFNAISIVPGKTLFDCINCKEATVTAIVKALFYNSEHAIRENDDATIATTNAYKCSYAIKPEFSYELKANKIRQHATNIDDLIERSEHAVNSIEIKNLVMELQKYEITVVKPPSLKGNETMLTKIQEDYIDNFDQAFDIGRFTILCDNLMQLHNAVAVMKKAEQFDLIVAEIKDFFDKQSKTHDRFHHITLYVPKHD